MICYKLNRSNTRQLSLKILVYKNFYSSIYQKYPRKLYVQHLTFQKWRLENIIGNPALDLLKKADKKIYNQPGILIENYTPCDAYLCFCFLNPELHIVSKTSHHAVIELHSYHTRGQVVLDHLKKKKPNVEIIEKYDEVLFKNCLLDLKNL